MRSRVEYVIEKNISHIRWTIPYHWTGQRSRLLGGNGKGRGDKFAECNYIAKKRPEKENIVIGLRLYCWGQLIYW